VCVEIDFLNFCILQFLLTGSLFLVLSPRLFCLDEGSLDFGDGCSIILASFAPENIVNDVSSSWKMGVWLRKKRMGLFFVIFST
jgi:hypothetical protein